MRVLVVDDSDVFRDVLATVVAATPGFEVVARASSGKEALALIETHGPQLVLLDVHMPEMDGIETALQIRHRHRDVIVLLLTASRRASMENLALAVEDKRDLNPQRLADFWHTHT